MESLLGLVRHSGNAALFQAVEMSILSTLSGLPLHLHAEGLRGTGKTTIFRGARRLLPRIRRIKGCPYNCDPVAPHCPQHRGLDADQVATLGSEWIPMPFLEISHSAKVGTVVGSIDLGRLVDAAKPEAALLPGTLPRAHRGIVFVDEINRLAETAPELADVLLDVMGTKPGRVQIEETGLPEVELTTAISVWAASNPDEDPGPLEEIRRQLSDRFDFVIPTSRPGEAEVVAEILDRFDGMLAVAGSSATAQTARVEAFRTRMAARPLGLRQIAVSPWMRRQMAEIYARFGLESLRGVQAMLWGTRLLACLAGRKEVTWEDLMTVVPLSLHHRVDGETVSRVLQYPRSMPVQPAEPPGADPEGEAGAPPAPPARAAVATAAETLVSWRPAQAVGGERPADKPFRPEGPERPPGPGAAAGAPPFRPSQPSAMPASGPGAVSGARAAAPAGTQPTARTTAQAGAQSREGMPLWNRVLSALRGHGAGLGQQTGTPRPGGPGGSGNHGNPGSAGAPRTGSTGGPGNPSNPSNPSNTSNTRPGGGGQPRMVNPSQFPPQAPPHQARPLPTLGSAEVVRTEADLQGGPGS